MQSPSMNLLSELRADALSGKISPALSVGLISGLVVLVRGISWGVIVFSGPLAPYSSQGTSVVLFGSFAVCLVVALSGSYRGTISALPAPCVVMLVAISSTLDAASDALFMSMVATLMLSALAAGAGFLMIGRFRLADLTRFIPYPVAGGFLAGTGGALCLAALVLMGISLDRLPALLNLAVAWNWGPGIAYGLGLLLATARWKSSWILPVSFVLVAVSYHLSLPLLGISADEARAAGLLFRDTAEGALWPAFGLGDVARVDWTAVAGQIPNMLALILVTLLCLVTGVGGLELAANRELEWNREFRAAGLANLVAGLGGGPPGCLITSNTVLSHLFGAETRLTGLVVAGVVGGALLFGQAVLQLVPVPLLGGVLLFTGLRMMNDWLVARRSRLPRTEYAIVVLIFVVITFVGVLEGVAVGMAVTTAFFVVRLSRVESVEARFSARERRSNTVRPVPDRAILRTEGEGVQAYRLRGYLFFGSAYRLADRLRQSLHDDEPRPSCILLDFTAVSGLDFSAINALGRFMHAAYAAGTRVVLSAASTQLKNELGRGLPPPVFDNLVWESDADRGLERCEDIVIAAWRSDPAREKSLRDSLLERVTDDMERQLDRQILFENLVHDLRDWLEPREYEVGEALTTRGEPQHGLQLLMTGRASAYDSGGTRLHQHGPGDVIEPQGAFGAHTATLATVADEPCRAMMLTPAATAWLEEHEGQLILQLYRYLLTATTPAVPS